MLHYILMRNNPIPRGCYDTFNRNTERDSSGSYKLGVTTLGNLQWKSLDGVWGTHKGKAELFAGRAIQALAVVETNASDCDVSMKFSNGAGDALYFRVKDKDNWLRLARDLYYTDITVPKYRNRHHGYLPWNKVEGYKRNPDNQFFQPNDPADGYDFHDHYVDSKTQEPFLEHRHEHIFHFSGTSSEVESVYGAYAQRADLYDVIYSTPTLLTFVVRRSSILSVHAHPDLTSNQSGEYVVGQQGNHRFVLQSCVDGFVSNIVNYTSSKNDNFARVSLDGNKVTVFIEGVNKGVRTILTHQNETKHGIGRSDHNSGSRADKIGIDNFRVAI